MNDQPDRYDEPIPGQIEIEAIVREIALEDPELLEASRGRSDAISRRSRQSLEEATRESRKSLFLTAVLEGNAPLDRWRASCDHSCYKPIRL
jgi:hypothetical protein